jgi:hypothetical protein
MNPIGIILIIIGFAALFSDEKKEQANPIHKRLNDSFKAELEELDRMEREIREEVKR